MQAWCEEDNFASEDAEFADITSLGCGSAWVSNNSDYITALECVVDFDELLGVWCVVCLAHDLEYESLCSS